MSNLMKLYHIVRPVLSLIPVGSFIIGIILSLFNPFSWSLYQYSSVFMFFILSSLSLPIFLLSYLSIFLLGISSSCLNSLVDAEDSDLGSFRKDYQNPIVYYGVSPTQMKIIMIFCFITSFFISLYVSLVFAVMILIGSLISISYSYYPRMKRRAPLDVIWNAVGLFTLPFIAGWIVFHNSSEILFHSILVFRLSYYFWIGGEILLIFMVLISTSWFPFLEMVGGTLIGGAFYVLTAVLDFDSDKRSGIKTISVFLGKRYSILLSLLLYVSGVLMMFEHIVFDWRTILLVFTTAFFMVYLVLKPDRKNTWNLIKWISLTTLILIATEIILIVIRA